MPNSNRRIAARAAVAAAMLVAATGCGSLATSSTRSTAAQTAAESALPSAGPSRLTVSATANIFGAGHDRNPQPGQGGGGSDAPVVQLPSGMARIVTFEDASGSVIPVAERGVANGPVGTLHGTTDIESFEGISGIVHRNNTMFLLGVFLTDAPPTDPAPERLDFSENEDFGTLEPEIGQVFFVGDGVGRRYLAPPEATRLFVGFADAAAFQGAPGYYGNNSGDVQVTVAVTVE